MVLPIILLQKVIVHGNLGGKIKKAENSELALAADVYSLLKLVHTAITTDNKWYILPLCSSCNKKSSDEVFEVREYDLVAVNS